MKPHQTSESKKRRKIAKLPRIISYEKPPDLAQRIALRLFTPGGEDEPRPAQFLKLFRDGIYVCGWSIGPAADAIREELNK